MLIRCLERIREHSYPLLAFKSLMVKQPYALALCLLSIFSIFVTELIAFRWGTAKLASVGHHHGELLSVRTDHSLING